MSKQEAYYEIARADVGRPTIKAFGRVWPVSGFIGAILTLDVGKRVFSRGDFLQVENNEQRDTRVKQEARHTPTPFGIATDPADAVVRYAMNNAVCPLETAQECRDVFEAMREALRRARKYVPQDGDDERDTLEAIDAALALADKVSHD